MITAAMFGSTVQASAATSVVIAPYNTLVAETQLVIGVAAGALFTVVAGVGYAGTLINSSVAGQIIRVGIAPSFGAPPLGIPIPVGGSWSFEFFKVTGALLAISSAAGGLLDMLVYRN